MLAKAQQYRSVTRSDFGGLVCAVLLKNLELINEIKFVYPKDMQDGKVEITNDDNTTNLPPVKGAYLAFDHHFRETLRNRDRRFDTIGESWGILVGQVC